MFTFLVNRKLHPFAVVPHGGRSGGWASLKVLSCRERRTCGWWVSPGFISPFWFGVHVDSSRSLMCVSSVSAIETCP